MTAAKILLLLKKMEESVVIRYKWLHGQNHQY